MFVRTTRWIVPFPLVLILAGLFTACSIPGTSSTSTTATPAPTQPPALTNYSGNGFTIGYPAGWKVTTKETTVTFTDPQGVASLVVNTINNPGGAIPSKNVVQAGLQVFKQRAKNYQTVSIASTTSLAGDTWDQGAATGDVTINGQSTPVNVKSIVIADNHPAQAANTKNYTIVYVTGSQVFDLANQGYFQPMLQSFKFA